MQEVKRDKYRQKRGGKSKFFKLTCSACMTYLLTYQKDGDGGLLRCYLNRIIDPSELEELQRLHTQKSTLPALRCSKCENLIGVPMEYTDGRLAFRIVPGALSKELMSMNRDLHTQPN